MPITKSASKALRKEKRKTKINKRVKSLYKATLAQARLKPTTTNIKKAFSVLDRAAKNNVIHKNKASRLKSKLAQLLHKKRKIKIKK